MRNQKYPYGLTKNIKRAEALTKFLKKQRCLGKFKKNLINTTYPFKEDKSRRKTKIIEDYFSWLNENKPDKVHYPEYWIKMAFEWARTPEGDYYWKYVKQQAKQMLRAI